MFLFSIQFSDNITTVVKQAKVLHELITFHSIRTINRSYIAVNKFQ